MKKMHALLASAVVCSLFVIQAPAQPLQPEDLASAAPVQHSGLEAKTVFVSSEGNRKSDSADRLTSMHQKQAAKGWSVVDVTSYDKHGFFVTYVKHEQKWTPTD